jgi:hypothetical protein
LNLGFLKGLQATQKLSGKLHLISCQYMRREPDCTLHESQIRIIKQILIITDQGVDIGCRKLCLQPVEIK